MPKLNDCAIEKTLTALQQEIEYKKTRLYGHNPQMGFSLLPNLFSEILNRANGPYTQINNALEHSREFVLDFLKNTQQNIQEKPWEVLRKVAIYSFSIGLFFSLRRRRRPAGGQK